MAAPVVTAYSRIFGVTLEDAFDRILPAPLPVLFVNRYGPLPPIKEVQGQQGAWGTLGQTRTIQLADGGTMHEELTRLERPSAFGYSITDVTGPMKALVSHVDGLWSFAAAGTGTRVTWEWTIIPKSALVSPIMPVFVRLWRGYAARAFDQIASFLSA
jgi:hypothetical protein